MHERNKVDALRAKQIDKFTLNGTNKSLLWPGM